jgi:hypothetical protein
LWGDAREVWEGGARGGKGAEPRGLSWVKGGECTEKAKQVDVGEED